MNTKSLLQLSNLIHESYDIDRIYDLACQLIVELTGTQGCAIYSIEYLDDSSQKLRSYPASFETPAPVNFTELIEAKSERNIITNKSLGAYNGQQYAGVIVPELKLLFLIALEEGEALVEEQCILYELISKQLIIAIEKNSKLSSAGHLDRLVEQATRLVDAIRGGLHKYDYENNRLVFIAGYNRYIGVSMSNDEGIGGRLIRSGEPYIIEKNYNESPYQHPFYKGKRDCPSILKVPLKLGSKIIGVLSVDAELGHEFTPVDAEKLIRFGQDHMVTELVRSDLLHRFEQINKVTSKIAADSARGELASTLQTIVVGCQEITNCSTATLYVYQAGAGRFYFSPVHVGLLFPEQEMDQIQIPDASIFYHSFDSGPYIVQQTSEDKYASASSFVMREQIKSYTAMPLNFQKDDGLRGILFVNYRSNHHFSPDEIDTISLIANQATVAIQNERRQRQLEEQIELYQSLRQTNFELTRDIDRDEFFETLVQRACKLLNAPRAGLREYDEVQNVLYLIAHWNRATTNPIMKIGEGFAGRLVMPGAPRRFMIIDNYDEWILKTTPELYGAQHGAVLAVSLHWDGKPIGVLFVNDELGRKFSEADAAKLQLFADQAAVALAKYRAVQRVNNIAKLVSEISPTILAGDLDSTLNQIVTIAKKMMEKCDIVTLYVVDREHGLLRNPPYHTGVRYPEQLRQDEFIPKSSKIYSLLEKDRYVVTPWDQNWLFKNKKFIVAEEIQSYVAIPLRTVHGNVGLLFAHYREKTRFRDQEIELLHQFANQAAVAIQSSQVREDITQRVKALDLLNKISNRITSKLTLKDLFFEIVKGAVELTGTSFGVIHQLERLKSGEYTTEDPITFPPNARYAPTRIKNHIGVTWTVATTGETQIYNEITKDNKIVNPVLHSSGIRSMIVSPLKLEDTVLGVLFLNDTKPRLFESIQPILEQLANHAAIAVYKAKQISALEELEKRQKEFVTIVVHELRMPLAYMQNSIYQLLNMLYAEPLVKDEIREIDRSIQHMSFLVNNLYNARRLQENKINFNPVGFDLKEIIAEAIGVVESITPYLPNTPSVRLELYDNGPVDVCADQDLIKQVITNLIHNAVKFSRKTGTITILKLSKNNQVVTVSIVDTGIGIPSGKLNHIQTLGFQVNSSLERTYEGMGVGLYVVTEFLKLHGVNLHIESKEGVGSTFSFSLLVN